MIHEIREEVEVGILINFDRIIMRKYANDIAVIIDKEDLQKILEIINLSMKNSYYNTG